MSRDWRPLVYDHEAIRETITKPYGRVTLRKVPHVGELIAWRNRKAYWVTAVEERERANWDEQTVKAWERDGSPNPSTWPGRERAVRMVPAAEPNARSHAKGLYPWSSTEQWWPLREQYPVCCDCGLIWPCPCDERTDEARAAMRELDRLGGIMPGCCWACSEPVTGRHHSIVFDGENLLLPGGGLVVFHTSHSRKAHQGTCRQEAEAYEQKWVLAGPGRAVRLRCAGILYRHIASSECTLGGDCPGVDATHAKYGHCTSVSYASWTKDGGAVEEPRPLTYCGTRGCRGPKVPDDAAALTGEEAA